MMDESVTELIDNLAELFNLDSGEKKLLKAMTKIIYDRGYWDGKQDAVRKMTEKVK